MGISLKISKVEQLFLFPFGHSVRVQCAGRNWLIESRPCLILLRLPTPGHFLRAGVISSPAGLVSMKCPEARVETCRYGPWPQGGSISSCPPPVPLATRALAKVVFLGWKLRLNGPAETPKSFCLIASSFSPSPGLIPRPATPRCAVG